MPITIDGINSGLDTETVIAGLLDIQQTHIDRLSLQRQDVISEQAAFASLQTQVLSFRSAAGRLARISNNVFEAKSVSVSDESALVATANGDAVAGNYQLSVESLAQAHQVATQGFSDRDAQITQGTFSVQLGSQPAVEVTIDGTNNTLQGLVDSVNLAQDDVVASIVNDGTGGGSSFRMLLTSKKTGEANAISVTNNLAASSGGAVKPAFDFGNPVQEAANAQIKLGSGAGALTAESDTNRLEDVISGVTLDLLQADAGKTISLQIAADTETAVGAVQDFVDAYNGIRGFVENQTRFVAETEDAGLLLGNRQLQGIESRLSTALLNVVSGVNTQANRLSAIGISVTDKGRLTFNAGKLTNILSGQTEGVNSQDVRSLFALDGESTNGGIRFILGTTRTKGSDNPIEVDITQAAERAAIQSTNLLAGSTVIDSSTNQLTLTLDGASLDVTLAEGTYTDSELAAEVESVINAHPDAIGRAVSVGIEDNGSGSNYLTITSDSYGASSQVTIQSGTALSKLGMTGVENEHGKDVEGTFTVDGVVEEAIGRGRVLSGKVDNDATADLQLRVTLTAAQLVSGSDAELTITRGVAARLDRDIGRMLDSENGLFKTIDDSYATEAETIETSIERQQELFEKQEQDLIRQFVALEQALGELQSTSSFLSQQFASLSTVGVGNKK